MKRSALLLAFAGIALAFPVRAQEPTGDTRVIVERPWPDSLIFANAGTNWVITSIANQTNQLFVGTTRFGMYRSDDNGGTWTQLTSVPEARVYSLAWCASRKIYAGLYTKGVAVSQDDGSTWNELSNGLPAPSWILDMRVLGDTVFAVKYGDDLFRSYDGGASWKGLGTPTPYIAGVVIDKERNLFVAGLAQGVLFSSDFGETWEYRNTGFPSRKKVYRIIIASDGTLYTGDDYAETGIHRSTNGGLNWERVGERALPRDVGALAASSDGYLYAGFEPGGVYRTKDRGDTWEFCGLANMSVWSLAVVDTNEVLVGSADGLWRLKFVRSGTTGIETVSEIPSGFELRQNYPNPFNPTTTIEFALPERNYVRLAVYNMLGQEVATLVDENISAGTHKTSWDATGLPSGIYFVRVEVHSGRSVGAKDFVATRRMTFIK